MLTLVLVAVAALILLLLLTAVVTLVVWSVQDARHTLAQARVDMLIDRSHPIPAPRGSGSSRTDHMEALK